MQTDTDTEDNRNVHLQRKCEFDRQTDGRMEAQKGQTDRQTDGRWTYGWKHRRNRKTDIQTDTNVETEDNKNVHLQRKCVLDR
jgi:hypothetical protein